MIEVPGTPRKNIWGCASHFSKPLHFLKANSFPRATLSENCSLFEEISRSYRSEHRAKRRQLFTSWYKHIQLWTQKSLLKKSSVIEDRFTPISWNCLTSFRSTVVSKILQNQLTVFEALLSSFREWLPFLTLRRDPLKYLIFFTKRRKHLAAP